MECSYPRNRRPLNLAVKSRCKISPCLIGLNAQDCTLELRTQTWLSRDRRHLLYVLFRTPRGNLLEFWPQFWREKRRLDAKRRFSCAFRAFREWRSRWLGKRGKINPLVSQGMWRVSISLSFKLPLISAAFEFQDGFLVSERGWKWILIKKIALVLVWDFCEKFGNNSLHYLYGETFHGNICFIL